jgi:asparagine N-glycosylation enzyme membrane subunit Stt3
MHREELQKFAQNRYAWLLVPAVSFGGIALRYLGDSFLIGVAGCLLAAFIIAGIAYFKPRRDVVSLFAPVYGVIIFFGLENAPTDITLWLFAASISALALRLQKRFSTA